MVLNRKPLNVYGLESSWSVLHHIESALTMKSLDHHKPLATVTKSALFNPIYWFYALRVADAFPT